MVVVRVGTAGSGSNSAFRRGQAPAGRTSSRTRWVCLVACADRAGWFVARLRGAHGWGDAGSCLWSADLSEEAFRTFIYLGEGSAVITIWGTVWMGAERAPLIDRSLAALSRPEAGRRESGRAD